MKIALGVLTAERPLEQTLTRTLASIGEWDGPKLVWEDANKIGAFKSWLNMTERLLQEHIDCDAYFLVEDDMLFCRDLRAFLDVWPSDPKTIAFCSPYSPTHYKKPQIGWHLENLGWKTVSACSWLMPRETLIRVVDTFGKLRLRPEPTPNTDRMVCKWAFDQKLDQWFHTPSLGHHIGMGNAALGQQKRHYTRIDVDFPGEEISCLKFRQVEQPAQ